MNAARLVPALALLWTGSASASSGVLHGRIAFYQNQGNYCPSSRSCTGANYLQSSYNTNMPAPDARVYVRDSAGNTIGSGVTDDNGYFTVSWYKSGSGSITGNFIWTAEHSGDRFNIRSDSGATWIMWTADRTLTNGTTSSAPQEVGTATWGSSSSPHGVANVYEGAWRMWDYALSYSSAMVTSFPEVEVRMYASEYCSTSCAYGSSGLIYLDDAADFTPQGRILHEMGHVASYAANPFSACAAYNYPTSPAAWSGSWSLATAEWACASFEEGLATFFGDVALYWGNATAPYTCLSSSYCSTYALETSSGSSCASGENRWAVTVDRYLWDVYDTPSDGSDTVDRSWGEIFTILDDFGDGSSNHQDDEPWSGSSVSDGDGRSAYDFYYVGRYTSGINTSGAYTNNCSPTGD